MLSSGTRLPRRAGVFAARLVQAQEEEGLKSEALARAIGAGLRLVQRWRSGEVEPSGRNLVRLARALRRDAAWFYEDDAESRQA
jgi:transcriptional regulator with XRE-family HTH domain